MENQLLKTLKNNKLFKGVDLSKIDFGEVKGKLITVNEGKILFRNTDPATNVYFLVSGEVNILNKEVGQTGASLKLENDFFGQDEVIEGVPRYSTAVVLRDSYIISLNSEEFNSIIDQSDQFYINLKSSDSEDLLDQIPDDLVDDHLPEPDLENALKSENNILDLGIGNSAEENVGSEIDLGFQDQFGESKSENSSAIDLNLDLGQDDGADFVPEESKEEVKFELDSIISDELSDISTNVEPEVKPQTSENTDIDLSLGNENKEEIKDDFDLESQLAEELNKDESVNFDDISPEIIDEESTVEIPDEETPESKKVVIQEEPEYAKPEETVNEPIEEPIIPSTPLIPKDDEIESPDIDKTRVKMLMRAAELVNSDLRVDDVLDHIVEVAAELANADRGTLYLINKDSNELWSKVIQGGIPKEIKLKIGEGIAGWVAKTSETVNIKDAKNDDRFNNSVDKDSGYTTNSMLCMAIKNKDRETVGVIQLLNSKSGEFTKLDEELINTISINCSTALENANMLEQLLKGERVSSLGKMANFLIQDIKKPVLVSKRYTEHLKNKDLPDDIKQVLDMMLDQINYVADVVQITSSYAEGNTILRTMDTNVQSVLNDFAGRIDGYITQRSCKIDLKIEENAPIKVDMKQFYQCFYHIVKNACDSMPEGGKVSVYTSAKPGYINIHLKDEGLGIPETMQSKIFEPFMTYGKKDGTGLGLSITKKIIEDHAGSIDFISNLGEGTEFIITLPENSPI